MERSGLFLYLHSNKKGITLNLETPTGRSILRDLISQSDALVPFPGMSLTLNAAEPSYT